MAVTKKAPSIGARSWLITFLKSVKRADLFLSVAWMAGYKLVPLTYKDKQRAARDIAKLKAKRLAAAARN